MSAQLRNSEEAGGESDAKNSDCPASGYCSAADDVNPSLLLTRYILILDYCRAGIRHDTRVMCSAFVIMLHSLEHS